jgi:hypothetical protein
VTRHAEVNLDGVHLTSAGQCWSNGPAGDGEDTGTPRRAPMRRSANLGRQRDARPRQLLLDVTVNARLPERPWVMSPSAGGREADRLELPVGAVSPSSPARRRDVVPAQADPDGSSTGVRQGVTKPSVTCCGRAHERSRVMGSLRRYATSSKRHFAFRASGSYARTGHADVRDQALADYLWLSG